MNGVADERSANEIVLKVETKTASNEYDVTKLQKEQKDAQSK